MCETKLRETKGYDHYQETLHPLVSTQPLYTLLTRYQLKKDTKTISH